MEVLIEYLAEILEIGFQEAKKLYPILRTQFIFYGILNSIKGLFGIISLGGFVLSLITAMGMMEDSEDGCGDNTENVRRFKKTAFLFIISLSLFFTSIILKYVLATDLMIIKDML